MSNPEQFIQSILPHALEIQKKYGIPASIVIAQAAVESGWGEHTPGGKNNLFGIKAMNWKGASVSAQTTEYENGAFVKQAQSFRAYDSTKESIFDYAKLIGTAKRYKNVLTADNAFDAAEELQKAGYAGNNPKYAQGLKNVIRSYDLTKYDDAKFKGYEESPLFDVCLKMLEMVVNGVGFVFEKVTSIVAGIGGAKAADMNSIGAPLNTPTKTTNTNKGIAG